jgi:hypothetical protein
VTSFINIPKIIKKKKKKKKIKNKKIIFLFHIILKQENKNLLSILNLLFLIIKPIFKVEMSFILKTFSNYFFFFVFTKCYLLKKFISPAKKEHIDDAPLDQPVIVTFSEMASFTFPLTNILFSSLN